MGGFGSYGGGSSSGFGSYKGASKRRSRSSQKKQGGALDGVKGFVGNLAKDVRDAAVGFIPGVVQTVRHPVRSAEIIGKTTWKDWSPLFRGDVDEWWDHFTDHPLAPMLDILSVVTLGAGTVAKGVGGAARVGGSTGKLSKLGQVSHREINAIEGAPTAFKQYSANPAIKLRQLAFEHTADGIAHLAPKWFGATTLKKGEKLTGRVRDLSDVGRQARWLAKDKDTRRAAVRGMRDVQIAQFMKAAKDISTNPQQVAEMFEGHGRRQIEAHAHRLAPSKLKTKGNRLVPEKGWAFVKENPNFTVPVMTTAKAYEDWLTGFGKRHETRDHTEALRDANGDYLIVSRAKTRSWYEEAVQSSRALRTMFRKPTEVWKWLTLATVPRYFVNNAVGNTFMYLASTGGLRGMRGLVDAQRQVFGEAKTRRGLSRADRALRKVQGDWQDRWYLGVHQGFGRDLMHTVEILDEGGKKKAMRVMREGLYPITHKVADVFLRRATINEAIRLHPEYQKLRKSGRHHEQAADLASRNPAVRDYVKRKVDDALGDYSHLSGLERNIREVVPFYTWDRAIARHGVHMLGDRPTTTALLSDVGAMGAEDVQEELGDIPDFLLDAVPLGWLGGVTEKDGRSQVLETGGLNPYASLPELFDTGRLAVDGKVRIGEILSMQINPIIVSLAEKATGQSLLSGAKLPESMMDKSLLPYLGERVFKDGTPQGRLLDALRNGPQDRTKDGPALFKKDVRQNLSSILGAPLKEVAASRARDLAKRDDKNNSPGF